VTNFFKTSILASAAVSAIVFSTPVFAQDAAPQDEASTEDGEIIVTASKREQTLQDVPISVSVTSAEQVERAQVRDLIDLQSLVPSLKVGQLQSSANTNFVIRGFGNGANNAGIEPSVGVFIDGVYRSRSAAQIGDLPNIQRVEVLRGPQSTLFGKNASAGIISIVTKEPKFEFGGGAEISYGNYNAIVVKADITGPIAETLAFSIAGNYNKRDGFGKDLSRGTDLNDRNRYGLRGQLLWEPSDAFKIRLIGDYDNIDEVCCTVANIFDGPTGGAVRALGGRLVSNQPFARDSYANFDSINKIKNYGVSGQIDWDVADSISLTSITAYRGVKSFTNQDSDFTSADIIGDNRNSTRINTYTQELRLASDFDGIFNFLIGGFYFKENIANDTQLLFGKDFRGYANLLSRNAAFPTGAYSGLEPTLRALLPGTPAGAFGAQGQGRIERYDYKNNAASVFGQIDLTPTEGLTLTAGFNYTNDRKAVRTNNVSTDVFSGLDLVRAGANAGVPGPFRNVVCSPTTGPACNPFLGLRPLQFLPPFLNFPNAVESGKTKDSDLSYTLRLAYKMSNRFSAYATYATGFKASSFNLSTDSRPFAAGFVPGSPFQVPAPAASPIRTALGANLPNNLTSGTRFAGPEDAVVYEVGLKGNLPGFDFNLAIFKQVLKGFQSNIFNGTGFVLGNAEKQSTNGVEIDASITPVRDLNFTASLTYLDPKFNSFTGGSAFNPATNNVVPSNLTGQRPTGISEWSLAVGGTYKARISDENAIIVHADYAINSAFQIAGGLLAKASVESLNASLALSLSDRFEFSVWGRNLTEPKYNPVIFPSVAQSGSLSGYPSPPRTYGASAKVRF
jgi:iron complex outermembrane recepter protein